MISVTIQFRGREGISTTTYCLLLELKNKQSRMISFFAKFPQGKCDPSHILARVLFDSAEMGKYARMSARTRPKVNIDEMKKANKTTMEPHLGIQSLSPQWHSKLVIALTHEFFFLCSLPGLQRGAVHLGRDGNQSRAISLARRHCLPHRATSADSPYLLQVITRFSEVW